MHSDPALKSLEWGVASRPKATEQESGDASLVLVQEHRALLAAVDGLGHGREAAAAARIAIEILQKHAQDTLISMIIRCHEHLIRSRGAAITLASYDSREATLTWMGIGNVEGILLRADPASTPIREEALIRGGVVGYQLPSLLTTTVHVSLGDTLILATDGINPSFAKGWVPALPPQENANRILAEFGKEIDDALVLVARFTPEGRAGKRDPKARP